MQVEPRGVRLRVPGGVPVVLSERKELSGHAARWSRLCEEIRQAPGHGVQPGGDRRGLHFLTAPASQPSDGPIRLVSHTGTSRHLPKMPVEIPIPAPFRREETNPPDPPFVTGGVGTAQLCRMTPL